VTRRTVNTIRHETGCIRERSGMSSRGEFRDLNGVAKSLSYGTTLYLNDVTRLNPYIKLKKPAVVLKPIVKPIVKPAVSQTFDLLSNHTYGPMS
jgi:hypothetical protein